MSDGHPTPEAAARGPLPPAFAPVLGIAHDPAGERAIVLVASIGVDGPATRQVLCVREADGGWRERPGRDDAGWHALEDGAGIATAWGEAMPGATTALVDHGDRIQPAPVTAGWFLFVAWDVPDGPPPALRGFLQPAPDD
jgi:hypothetical protein